MTKHALSTTILFFLFSALMAQVPGTNIYYNSTYQYVGIGTSNPQTQLHINGNAAASSTYTNAFVQLWGDNALIWKRAAPSLGLRFGCADDMGATNWSEKMRLLDDGGLIVGREAPSSFGRLEVYHPGGSSPFNILYLHTGSFVNADNARASYFMRMVDDGNGATQFMVRGDGTVGIGTANTGSNRLAVDGSIGARKVVVTQNAFADYVFDEDYPLPSLDSVSRYIKTNHHLADIPSADSVAKNGLDLGDNQTQLVRKVEELTLYILQQQKDIEALKAENKRLAAKIDSRP